MNTIPILMYHNVAPYPEGLRAMRSLYVKPSAFSRQMAMLRMLGYRGVSMSEAVPYLRGDANGRVAIITLDDGYLNNLTHALPILQRHRFSATCYVVSAAPGNCNHWNMDHTGVREPLMDDNQLRKWLSGGMEVGAHTRSHVHLTLCDDATLNDEIRTSKAELEDRTGQPVTQFCYPYGDHDSRVTEAVQEAGYADAVTTLRGHAHPQDNRLRWPRLPIRNHDTLAQIATRLLSNYDERRKYKELKGHRPD